MRTAKKAWRVFLSRERFKGFMIFLCVILITEMCIFQLYCTGKNQDKKRHSQKIFNYNDIILRLRRFQTNVDLFDYNITDVRVVLNDIGQLHKVKNIARDLTLNSDWSVLVGSDMKDERVAIIDTKEDALIGICNAIKIDFNYTLRNSLDERRDWILLYSLRSQLDFTKFSNLQPHQLVSVIPGTNPITRKTDLSSIHSGISHIKPAFSLPRDKQLFIKYAKANPNVLWLQKGHNHRGIKLIELEEILSKEFDGSKYFIQEFITDPFLIENRKFDIGIHAVITSAHPLRLYVDSGEWNIKFCIKDFLPFNRSDTDSYIEKDSIFNIFTMNSMIKYLVERDLKKKEAFLQYLHDTGHEQAHVESSIYEALAEVGAVKDAEVWKATQDKTLPSDYKNRNYFELIRFDVCLDSKLHPWIIEANFGPDLGGRYTIRRHISKLRHREIVPEGYTSWNMTKLVRFLMKRGLWSQEVIKSMLTLVGVPFSRTWADETDKVDDELIKVDTDNCKEHRNCKHWESAVCWRCLNDEDKLEMKRAYLEHYRKGAWKRATPRPLNTQENARRWRPETDILYQKLTDRGKRSFLWFRLKCLQKVDWCQ